MTVVISVPHGIPTGTFRRSRGLGHGAPHESRCSVYNEWRTAKANFSRAMRLSKVVTQADLGSRLLSTCYEGLKSAYARQSNEYRRRCETLEWDYQVLRAVVSQFRKKPGTHIDFSTGERTTRRFTSDGQVQQLVVFGELPAWVPIRGATRDLRDQQKSSWYAVSAQYKSWLNLTDDLRRVIQDSTSALTTSQKRELRTFIDKDSESRKWVLDRWKHVWGKTCGPENEGWASYVYTDGTIDEVPTNSAGTLPPNDPALRTHIDTYLKLR